MQAEQQYGFCWHKCNIHERTSSYSIESGSTSSAVTSSSSCGSSASPIKQSTSGASSKNSSCTQLSSSISNTLWKRVCSLYGMLTATGPSTTPKSNTAAAADAASEEVSNAGYEAYFAQELTPGLNGMYMTNKQMLHHGPIARPEPLSCTHQGQTQAVYASCQQQQQQQLGPVLQAIVAATACWPEVPLMPTTPQGLCHQYQQQQQWQHQQLDTTNVPSQPELSTVHLHHLQYNLRLDDASAMHMTPLPLQQQQQMSQHAYAQFAAVQQQQTQRVPVMVTPQACPAAATVATPFAVPIIQPALNSGTCTSNAAAAFEKEQTQPIATSSSSGGNSLWRMTWSLAGTTVQHVAVGKQGSSSRSSGSAEHLPGKCTEPAHWVTSSWLYVLTCLVAAMRSVHKAMQAVLFSILGKRFTCANSSNACMQQQLQLLQEAAAEAANAEGKEHLWRLFGRRQRNSSSSSSNEEQLSAKAPAQMVAAPQGTASRQHLSSSSSSSSDKRNLDGLEEFIITTGLCAGAVVWAGKWLVVHAPATTGSAISYRLQQGSKAAEEACLLLLECILLGCYDLAWFMWRQAHGIAVKAVQLGAVHGTATAQHACCAVLWMVALANASSSSTAGSSVQQQQQSAAQLLLVRVLQGGGRAAAKFGQAGVVAVESVVTAVAGKLLRDASPVTQTAVCGLAGMLRRNAVESCSLCWQLLLQLSQVYMIQQQQQQQQQWQQQELKQQ